LAGEVSVPLLGEHRSERAGGRGSQRAGRSVGEHKREALAGRLARGKGRLGPAEQRDQALLQRREFPGISPGLAHVAIQRFERGLVTGVGEGLQRAGRRFARGEGRGEQAQQGE